MNRPPPINKHFPYTTLCRSTLERQVKEAAQTLAAFDTAQLLARRYDPEIVSLKEQRERLAREWQYAKQELWGHQDRRVEAVGNGDMYHYDGDKLEREIADAEAALNVFDDTHPEIVSLLNAERDESTERNMWN